MSFSNHRLRWLAVFGGLICLLVGNTSTAQDESSRDRVTPADGPMVQQVTGATFDDPCNAPNLGPPPCDDTTRSLGGFAILVDPRWRDNMDACPGYDSGTGILTSPTLEDPATIIGRSIWHLDGPIPPDAPPGTLVGKTLTPISDATFSLVPTDKAAEGFAEGPVGTREVHTEILSLNLCVDGIPGNLPCVRAGLAAVFKILSVSPGEVESKSDDSGDPKLDFPAESFFNMFVEVELPPCGSEPFPGTVLHNDAPLLVTNNELREFPPQVVYIHGSTPAIPIYFNVPHPMGKWIVGDRFGWLLLAGHGVAVSPEQFGNAMDAAGMMCVDDGALSCWSGCLSCEDPGCSEQIGAGAIAEETNFSPVHLALVGPSNVNKFMDAVQDILAKQNPPPKEVEPINTVQDAIDAIHDDFKLQGPQRVVIFGYGSSGHFRIGNDDLADPGIQDKFITAVKGKIKSLTLYGCEVSDGAEGQAFLKKLTEGLQRPVHTWEGKVYAFGNDPVIPVDMRNRFYIEDDTDKKEIPAVTEWGMVVMVLLVLAAGTVVIRRARTVAAQA